MPLMNTPFHPGECQQVIDAMPEGVQRDIATAEYHYFSGQAEKAAQEAELYLTDSDREARLSACLMYAYANLTLGRIQQARVALAELQTTLSRNSKSKKQVAAASFAGAAAVLLHLPPAGRAASRSGIPAASSTRTARLCLVRTGALPLFAEKIPAKHRDRGGDLGHGSRSLYHPGDLSASGGGDGPHEPAPAGSGPGAYAGGVGDCPSRRPH